MLKLSGVNVHYGKLHILRGVSLEVGSGESVALLGRNGVGKTTTLRAIMGLARRSAGSVEFDGVDLARVKPDAETEGYVFAHFPRLKERMKQPGGTLSGGEQQMLAIARCLMMRPKLIILDEPTEGIMPLLVTQIRREIRRIHDSGVSILLVEQNVETALRLCPRVVIMEKGSIVHTGTSAELKSRPEILHRYLGLSLQRAPAV